MTTMLALMMVAHMGSPNLGNLYSREAEKRFWLIGSSHGMWEGRRAGPYSERETSATIEQQRIRRANISLALPADLGHIAKVLEASDSELSKLMQSDEPLLVKNAIGEAVLRRTPVPVAALCKLADGGAFRTDAIPALAMIGGEDAVNCLRGQLSDDDKLVSALAAYGLAAHGRRDGVRELWHALRNPITGEAFHDRIIRGGAARALVELGEIDTRRELDELFELARAEGRYLCPLLARSGKPAQLAKLRDLAVDSSTDHLVRKWAVTALGDIRDRAAVVNLKRSLTDPSRQVREAAQVALQKIGS